MVIPMDRKKLLLQGRSFFLTPLLSRTRISHEVSSRNSEDACGYKAREARATAAYLTVRWGGRMS